MSEIENRSEIQKLISEILKENPMLSFGEMSELLCKELECEKCPVTRYALKIHIEKEKMRHPCSLNLAYLLIGETLRNAKENIKAKDSHKRKLKKKMSTKAIMNGGCYGE